jgi:hypothetical protein
MSSIRDSAAIDVEGISKIGAIEVLVLLLAADAEVHNIVFGCPLCPLEYQREDFSRHKLQIFPLKILRF